LFIAFSDEYDKFMDDQQNIRLDLEKNAPQEEESETDESDITCKLIF